MRASVVSLALVAAACGPGAYGRHATALDATRVALDTTITAIEEGCLARAQALPPGLDGDADAARLRERCTAAHAAHETARVAWESWLDALTIAVAGDDQELLATLLQAALAAIRAYAAIAEALGDVGVDVPPIPAAAAAILAGGAS